jgi:hypothetical protein
LVLKALGLMPVASLLGGTIATPAANSDVFYITLTGEILPFRGGAWDYAATAGVFTLHCANARTYANGSIGARPAFVS